MGYYFAKFYQIDTTIEQLEIDQNNLRKKAKVAEKIRASTKKNISDFKQQLTQYKEQLRIQSENSKKSQAEVSKFSLELTKLQKKLLSYEKETVQVSENLNKAKKKDEMRKNNLDNLRQQYKEVERAKENFLVPESQMSSISLNEEQV